MHLIASRLSSDRDVDASAALSVVLELTGADRGLVVSPAAWEPIFKLGAPPCQPAVIAWAHDLLEDALEPELETVVSAAGSEAEPDIAQEHQSELDAPNIETFDEIQYRSTTLWNRDGSPLVVLVVGSARALPQQAPAPFLGLLHTVLADYQDVGQAHPG